MEYRFSKQPKNCECRFCLHWNTDKDRLERRQEARETERERERKNE
jgi:hypothetical protein